jgi:hypothetical protein
MSQYNMLSKFLDEMSTAKVAKHGFKRITRNLKKDPTSAALIVAPVPASNIVGTALHLSKNKGSRNTVGAMAARAVGRPKAAQRAAKQAAKQKQDKFRKFLSVSKAVS